MRRRWSLGRIRYGCEVFRRVLSGSGNYVCPCCGYEGRFDAVGQPPRYGALCPVCGSFERHRLLKLTDKRLNLFEGLDVLHFAPEPPVSKLIAPKASSYVTADIESGRADRVLNIEKIDDPDGSWDVIVASHVLEHVDDAAALSEMHRVLRAGGLMVIMVPIVEAWGKTYENPSVVGEQARELHFGQNDHVRYYGRDIRDRIRAANFTIEAEEVAQGDESVSFGLMRGETVFLCRKAAGE